MNKTELKYAAQDDIMRAIANGLLLASESGDTLEHIEEMRKQAERVLKLFGYDSFNGIK